MPQLRSWKAAFGRLEAGLEAAGATKLETGFQAKAAMTFQQFCQQVLGQDAATAKQMNDLWLVYATGKVGRGAAPPMTAARCPAHCCTMIPNRTGMKEKPTLLRKRNPRKSLPRAVTRSRRHPMRAKA